MTSFCVTSFKKVILEFKEDSVQIPTQQKSDPLFPSRQPSKASRRSSVSNICPDDVAIPSGLPSVSRSFTQFKVASIHMSLQNIRTLFRVLEESSVQVHPSRRRGNTFRTPISVRQVKGFPLQTQIWEDSYNRPDGKSTPFGRYP
jgi:hypothetical protein